MKTKFSDLLYPTTGLSVAEQQRAARRRFSSVIATSHMNMWKPGEPIARSETRLLIGIATYSRLDLRLLDEIDLVLDRSACEFRVDLFDIQECSTMADIEKYVPGIGEVYQTPVLGVWINGKLCEFASGFAARERIYDFFRLRQEDKD